MCRHSRSGEDYHFTHFANVFGLISRRAWLLSHFNPEGHHREQYQPI